MEIRQFTFNPFQTNCFVAHDAGKAALLDAACLAPAEFDALIRYIESKNLEVERLLLTHAHIDHIFGCAAVSQHFDRGFEMHRADLPLIQNAAEQARFFGIEFDTDIRVDAYLDEGDSISLGGASWSVLHTPGHSPGSICFHDAANGFVVAGDVLFRGSIGRTDLWQGSLPALMQSIFQKLAPLDPTTVVYCGHGPSTTISHELETNPFLTGPA